MTFLGVGYELFLSGFRIKISRLNEAGKLLIFHPSFFVPFSFFRLVL